MKFFPRTGSSDALTSADRASISSRAAAALAKAMHLFRNATSLGGVESLIEHRAAVEGPESPIPRDLLRVSCGIEQHQDLIADLDRALAVST